MEECELVTDEALDADWDTISVQSEESIASVEAESTVHEDLEFEILTTASSETSYNGLAQSVESLSSLQQSPYSGLPIDYTETRKHLNISAAREIPLDASISSCGSIWPADIDSIATRQGKDANFLPPPSREADLDSEFDTEAEDGTPPGVKEFESFQIADCGDCWVFTINGTQGFQYQVSSSILSSTSPIFRQKL